MSQVQKLWETYDIPVVCLAGEVGSGKSMWGITAGRNSLNFDLPPDVLVWDTEGSVTPYVGALNFKQVDLRAEAIKKAGSKYSNADMFDVWRKGMEGLQKGKYAIGVIDTVSPIESGLADYVRAHPGEFGYTAGQFAKMEGLFWGAVKTEYERLLTLASQKFETLVLTVHMKTEFKGSRPTGRKLPKGKETLMHLASIYLTLNRSIKPGAKELPIYPSASCRPPYGKSRLVRYNKKTGELQPLLPPHIPNASPQGIREYLRAPPDFSNLKAAERAKPDQVLSEDDRLVLKAGIANDEAVRAQSDLSRVELEKEVREEVKPKDLPLMKEDTLVEQVKKEVLTKVTVNLAKEILTERYNVKKIADLDQSQIEDLRRYMKAFTLKKQHSGRSSSDHS